MSEEFDLRSVGGILSYSATAAGDVTPKWDFGWYDNPAEVSAVVRTLPFPIASGTPAGEVDAGDLPKQVFLWQAYRKLTGGNPPAHNQGQVGSCVSFGTCTAIRRTMAVEIALLKEQEELTEIVEEVVYGGSRVEVGGGRIRGDGSVGAWAAEFVRRWGVLARGTYDRYDLTRYSESTCRDFGYSGVPDELEPVAKEHPVREVTKVDSWASAKRMLASGYGIAVCSDQGFSMRRDAQGVASPSGTWAHCMALDGYVVLDGGAEYGHIVNSWGTDAHTGPVGWGDPGTDGFWAEAAVVNRMLSQGDSWAFSGLQGFPARKIQWDKII
jgi:hypothetical protein